MKVTVYRTFQYSADLPDNLFDVDEDEKLDAEKVRAYFDSTGSWPYGEEEMIDEMEVIFISNE